MFSLRRANAAANASSENNNNPSQQNSATLPQSTTISANPSENTAASSSIFGRSGDRDGTVRETQGQHRFGANPSMTREQRMAKFLARNTVQYTPSADPPQIPSQGTVDYIGQSHVHPSRLDEGEGRVKYFCITGTIQGHCLDEIRAKDYFNLKENLLPPEKKQLVDSIIARNEQLQLSSERCLETSLPPPTLLEDSQSSLLTPNSQNNAFGGTTQPSGSLFTNSQSQNITVSALKSTQSGIQKAEKITKATAPTQQIQHKKTVPKKSVQPVQEVTAVEAQEDGIAQQTVMSSNPGSFGYEMNKMLFFSGLSQAMEKHNLTVPENVLDETDFVAKFVEFLGQYNINLPTENVPQFELNSITTLMKKQGDE